MVASCLKVIPADSRTSVKVTGIAFAGDCADSTREGLHSAAPPTIRMMVKIPIATNWKDLGSLVCICTFKYFPQRPSKTIARDPHSAQCLRQGKRQGGGTDAGGIISARVRFG